ncbi:C-type lectin domain family 4 member A-like [Octodon degus]|uniref:C-type lectin domain family 4 member A-like n=1 Tax=Octodon degus TaxID=10160 RepID=A0A6P6E288_OCTDE|nr:C-type lectin domain family 4 member A-like [Octodon degus]
MTLETLRVKAPQERVSPGKYTAGSLKLLFASLLVLFLLKVVLSSVTCIVFSKNILSMKKNVTVKELVHTELECVKNNHTTEGYWSPTQNADEFIAQNVKKGCAYYVGLSDPEGQRHWQWVDQTPYDANVTFWHPKEPNNKHERCVTIDYRQQWGWNDFLCDGAERSVCEMMKIYL